MSGDGEGFLGRWSRLKRQGPPPEREAKESPANADRAGEAAPPEGTPSSTSLLPEMPELPAIETITAGSDVSAFMHPAVPESLRQAALRRLWSVDPSIRDFISPAVDYAYDWNTPGGAPGWGALGSADDVARMLGQVIDGFARDPEAPDGAAPDVSAPTITAEPEGCGVSSQVVAGEEATPVTVTLAVAVPPPEAQPVVQTTAAAPSPGHVRTAILNQGEFPGGNSLKRRHGGALPH